MSLGKALESIDAEMESLRAEHVARLDRVRAAAQDPANLEPGTAGRDQKPVSRRSNPSSGIERSGSIDDLDSDTGLRCRSLAAVETFQLGDDVRAQLAAMIEADRTSDSARFVLALGNPAYRGAFDNWLRSPETASMDSTPEELAAWRDVRRTALTTANGSAVMPLELDPALHLTNTGSASNVRKYATVKLTHTNQFRAVTSAGITAEWKAEGTVASDATPTLTAADLSVYQGFASVMGSYELFEDTDAANRLLEMFADARARLEDDAFVVGSGSGAPYGFVTRLAATTGSRVACTTASSFTPASVVDVYRLRDAVPARHRQSRGVAMVANIAVASVIQQMSPSANGGSFWSNLGDGVQARLLGIPFEEATSMSSAVTGTTQPILACVNLSEYVIADRLGTEVQRHNVSSTGGRSTGQWEFTARWRTSGDLVNTDAGRMLRT